MTRTPLSTADRESLRKVLESKRAELVAAQERNLAVATTPDDDDRADPMDAATRALDEAEVLELARQERALLADVDRALRKIADGSYGVSELSGRPIPLERLRAVPWARLAADEEEDRERLR